ncbi:MAG: BLUF domain-containing protein [Rubrivivax sp.]|nr:BLUF domain-containing protein [Rubrivivax sp.]
MPPIHQIVYCSRAAAGINDAAVEGILKSAHRNNPRNGITGLLVFGGGMFFQWIEGPRANIRKLMEVIKADSRHESVVVLSETEEVRERLFPDWDMELVTPDDIRVVLLDAHESASDAQSIQALDTMLEQLESGPLCSNGRG